MAIDVELDFDATDYHDRVFGTPAVSKPKAVIKGIEDSIKDYSERLAVDLVNEIWERAALLGARTALEDCVTVPTVSNGHDSNGPVFDVQLIKGLTLEIHFADLFADLLRRGFPSDEARNIYVKALRDMADKLEGSTHP